jgi:hypothetical protein
VSAPERGRPAGCTGVVVVEQTHGHALQRLGDGGDLGEDVDAVPVVLHHLGQPPDLSFHPAEPAQEFVLVHVVLPHDDTIPL